MSKYSLKGKKNGEDAHESKAQMAGTYPGFLSMKEYCYFSLDGRETHCKSYY